MIRQNDIAMIILVVAISLIASFFAGNLLINTPQNRSAKVEVVPKISPDFPLPSEKIFNDEAINPTELIKIGDDGSDDPFGGDGN